MLKTLSLKHNKERQELETNLLVVLVISLGITIGIYALLLPIRNSFIGILLYQRGFTQVLVMLLAGIVVATTVLKLSKLQREFRALKKNPIPLNANLDEPTSRQVANLQQSLAKENSLIGTRCSRVLGAYIHSGNRKAASEFAIEDSTFYSSASESSYTFPRILVWAIPLLGFIGTVIGISQAVNGFSGFLQEAGEIEQIKEGIGTVTSGLAVAFDTTLLALFLSVLVMIPLVLVERQESQLLLAIDAYINDQLLPRLKDTSEALNKAVISEAINQAFQTHLPSPEVLIKPAEQYAQQAAQALAKGFVTEISKLQGMNNKLIQQIHQVSKMAAKDRQDFLTGFEEQQQTSKEVVDAIQATVEQVQASHTTVANGLVQQTEEISQQLEQAAQGLQERVRSLESSLSQLSQIADLQQSLNNTLNNLEQAAQLANVMTNLQGHLAELKPVLEQLNKPRRITLVEQDNGSR